jgi:hypothetical protein
MGDFMKITEREHVIHALTNPYCDLGVNGLRLFSLIEPCDNLICVDLGVRHGVSSAILSYRAEEKNTHIFGCDITFNVLDEWYDRTSNYHKIAADSVTLGKMWGEGLVDLVFVDTLHVREQVLAELYFWTDYIKPNGFFVFHDTEWEDGICEIYDGRETKTVNHAVMDFFGLKELDGEYEDDHIAVRHFKESYGMTFVQIKDVSYIPEYKKNIDWEEVFEMRNFLTNIYFNRSSPYYIEEIDPNCLNEMVITV